MKRSALYPFTSTFNIESQSVSILENDCIADRSCSCFFSSFANANPFYGDDPPLPFSYETEKVWIEPERQIICYTTFTKPELKKIIMGELIAI